ncbi:MAG TPA: DNA topoisomerase IV subunit B, partial [Anaerolineales bacterium]|nr:DNA topoisomerase IV subunit B [Anaerolineales bacterium]
YTITEVKRDCVLWRQRYERGIPTGRIAQVGDVPAGETGTTQTFKFDRTIFKEPGLDFKFEVLAARFREMAFVARGVWIDFIDERDAR